jgi:uncharacterized protein (DUF2164 family)
MQKSKKTQSAILVAKNLFSDRLQKYLEEEHGVSIGKFEAEEIFEESFKTIAPILYNQALLDAKEFFQERFADLSEDVIQLEISAEK